ncbi:hypothetical protein EST38_g4242 [Candolleomyces aberdarensis]|uniref:Uncharacterized protein n=1 Tax=Candolleomyces aberdarensis TaxID=2316362 RepID=A0A4Q2DNG0_9AGAR|nr:hypothetical protein EST38_g4242 [Candolleomyces aberdarensis]
MAPRTPLDLGSHILARMHLEDHPEELELEPAPRGRSLYAPVYQDDDDEDAAAYAPTGHDVVEDDKLGGSPPSVAAQWTSAFFSGFMQGREDEASRSTSSDGSSSRYRSCSSEVGVDEEDEDDVVSANQNATFPWNNRPGSHPPTTRATPQAWDSGLTAKGEGLVAPRDYFFGGGAFSGSGAASPSLISRSRSADVQQTFAKPPQAAVEVSTPVSS